MLCKSDGCFLVEDIAFEREVVSQEIVTDEWDAVRTSGWVWCVVRFRLVVKPRIERSVFENAIDLVVDATSVKLNEATCSHVELEVISFELLLFLSMVFLRWLCLLHILRLWLIRWLVALDEVCQVNQIKSQYLVNRQSKPWIIGDKSKILRTLTGVFFPFLRVSVFDELYSFKHSRMHHLYHLIKLVLFTRLFSIPAQRTKMVCIVAMSSEQTHLLRLYWKMYSAQKLVFLV